MKPKLKFIFISMVLLLIIGQESLAQKEDKKKKAGEEERINPKFSYSPPTRDSVASTGLTIALLNPVFSNRDIGSISVAGSPWSDFARAMASDIDELLISKGFKVRGPFNSIDEMVVSDKSNSDFIMKIVIDLEPNLQRKWDKGLGGMFSNAFTYKVKEGNGSISGKVQLTALSCFSSEKLWAKNLDINQKNFSYKGTIKWPTIDVNPITEVKQDVNLWNPICKILEEIYNESFDILYKQFSKEEMVPVAEESRKTDKSRRGN